MPKTWVGINQVAAALWDEADARRGAGRRVEAWRPAVVHHVVVNGRILGLIVEPQALLSRVVYPAEIVMLWG